MKNKEKNTQSDYVVTFVMLKKEQKQFLKEHGFAASPLVRKLLDRFIDKMKKLKIDA